MSKKKYVGSFWTGRSNGLGPRTLRGQRSSLASGDQGAKVARDKSS